MNYITVYLQAKRGELYMQGYSPNLSIKPETEVASKIQRAFIELGVKNDEHEANCKCEVCIEVNK